MIQSYIRTNEEITEFYDKLLELSGRGYSFQVKEQSRHLCTNISDDGKISHDYVHDINISVYKDVDKK